MSTFQTQIMKELAEGHDGSPIPATKRAYFQQRLRNTFFEFLLSCFAEQQKHGLTKAKLARRIGKTPDVVNRWLSAPSNLTLDTISDLLLGIAAAELKMKTVSYLNRAPRNFANGFDVYNPLERKPTPSSPSGGFTELRDSDWQPRSKAA